MSECDPFLLFPGMEQIIINHYRKSDGREKIALEESLLMSAISTLRATTQPSGIKELEMLMDAFYDSVSNSNVDNTDGKQNARYLIKFASVLFKEYLDYSQRKAQKEREASEQELRRGIVAAQENERRRVAMLLHDDAVQSMASVLLRVQLLGGMIKGDSNSIRKELKEIEEIIRDVISGCRLAALDRDLFLLEKAGFVPTVESYIMNFQNKYGIRVTVELKDTNHILSQTAVHLFYIIKEALTNVQKHAEASLVAVLLQRNRNELALSIEDNGKGFLVNYNGKAQNHLPSAEHFGLYCIEQRAKLINGKFLIKSGLKSGTKLIVTLPVNGPVQGRVTSGYKGGSPWVKQGF